TYVSYAICYCSDTSQHEPLSFPTRRSSDLAHRLTKLVLVNPAAEAAMVTAVVHVARRSETREHGRPDALDAHERGHQRGLAPLLDRKSTRLNSSHVKISYAVFCLKKKKHIQ